MVYSLKGLSTLSHAARAAGHEDPALNAFVHSALFSTLTNVNFDDSRMEEFVEETVRTQARLEAAMRVSSIHLSGMLVASCWACFACLWCNVPAPCRRTQQQQRLTLKYPLPLCQRIPAPVYQICSPNLWTYMAWPCACPLPIGQEHPLPR